MVHKIHTPGDIVGGVSRLQSVGRSTRASNRGEPHRGSTHLGVPGGRVLDGDSEERVEGISIFFAVDFQFFVLQDFCFLHEKAELHNQ